MNCVGSLTPFPCRCCKLSVGPAVERLVEEFKGLQFGLSCLWAMEGPPFRAARQALEAQARMFARAAGGKKS